MSEPSFSLAVNLVLAALFCLKELKQTNFFTNFKTEVLYSEKEPREQLLLIVWNNSEKPDIKHLPQSQALSPNFVKII